MLVYYVSHALHGDELNIKKFANIGQQEASSLLQNIQDLYAKGPTLGGHFAKA